MNEIRVDFEKKLHNLTILHDLYLERMLRTSEPLNQDTLLIIVDGYKKELAEILEIVHHLQYHTGQIVFTGILNQIAVYKFN